MSLDLANGPRLEGICLLNIPSAHAGSNLWGENTTSRKKHKMRESDYTVTGSSTGGDLHCAVQGMYSVTGYINCICMAHGDVARMFSSAGVADGHYKYLLIHKVKSLEILCVLHVNTDFSYYPPSLMPGSKLPADTFVSVFAIYMY